MSTLRAQSLQPFVPSGKDYDASRRFFADLGFEEVWENDGYAGFRNGDAQFILQKFDDATFAGNFMVRLNVKDLDAWWRAVSLKQLDQTYPAFRIKPPGDFPWGREANFIDLAGVCWHVGQAGARGRAVAGAPPCPTVSRRSMVRACRSRPRASAPAHRHLPAEGDHHGTNR